MAGFSVVAVIDDIDDEIYRLIGAAAVAALVASLLTRILRGTGARGNARRASAEGELHRLRLGFETGDELVQEVRAASFATAAARAIERAERERSSRVQRLERLSQD